MYDTIEKLQHMIETTEGEPKIRDWALQVVALAYELGKRDALQESNTQLNNDN